MKSFDILAYTANADCLCPDCAEKAYGLGALGICPECQHYLRFPQHGAGVCDDCGWTGSGLLDGEGNEVHPIFVENESEYAESGLYCGQCGEEIIPPEPPACGECGGTEGLEESPEGLLCEECRRSRRESPPTIQGSNWLALKILDWHGGQWSPSYGVGSCWLALREVPVSLAWEAQRELRRVPGAGKVALALAELLEGSGFPEGGS